MGYCSYSDYFRASPNQIYCDKVKSNLLQQSNVLPINIKQYIIRKYKTESSILDLLTQTANTIIYNPTEITVKGFDPLRQHTPLASEKRGRIPG